MNLVLLGPQGSGKGTQAALLARHLKLPTLSVGQLYRQEINSGSAIGKKAAPYVLKGKLVPNVITEKLLRRELARKIYKQGLIFDGFPRNFEQNKFLEKILKIDLVILIDISHGEILKRLSQRYVCACGQTYNLAFKEEKPKRSLLCDKCSGRLKQRADDRPQAIRQRLQVYQKQTKPLLQYYRGQHKLITISGEQKAAKVYQAILQSLKHQKILR